VNFVVNDLDHERHRHPLSSTTSISWVRNFPNRILNFHSL